jgi:hypothetical protein
MTKVKNLNGTTDNTPPRGYVSWKDWWEAKKAENFQHVLAEDAPVMPQ